MNRKGGYQIIDLKGNDLTGASFTISGIYDALEGNYNKAILLSGIVIGGVEYDDVFTTPKVVSSNYVLDAYGYTLTIDNDDLVTMGEVQTLFENIVDSNGNNRFIEGNIEMDAITGVTQTYGKWSLSGSHLMLVIAFEIEANTSFSNVALATIYGLPSWILAKIIPATDNEKIVTIKFAEEWEDNNTPLTPQMYCGLQKTSDTYVNISTWGSKTYNNKTFARVQFDLVIDNE